MTLLGVWQLMSTSVFQLPYLSSHMKGGWLRQPKTTSPQLSKKKLRISLPWLTEIMENPDEEGHPFTGSSSHYVLYDKFHEANTKDPQEVLRRINLVPELQSSLNSQVAEQLFSSMRKNNYFLNNMAPSTHIFLMRSIVNQRNINTNTKLLEQQLHSGHKSHRLQDITMNAFGHAVFGKYEVIEMFLFYGCNVTNSICVK